jgi:hypothetical protein
MDSGQPLALNYEKPSRRRVSIWALVGLGLALWSLAIPAMMWWFLWEDLKRGSHSTLRIDRGYYALPSAALMLSAMGLRGRPKLFPVLGIVVALLAAAATLVACLRLW